MHLDVGCINEEEWRNSRYSFRKQKSAAYIHMSIVLSASPSGSFSALLCFEISIGQFGTYLPGLHRSKRGEILENPDDPEMFRFYHKLRLLF